MQKGLIPEASGVFPWQAVQYANWCDHANTTTTKIPVSTAGFTLYKVNTAQQIMKYQIPFFIQEPLDTYGNECPVWSQDAIASHPSLKTYNSTGKAVDNTRLTYVRVDDMNFAVQYYRDLVNLKNNLKGVTTYQGHTLLDYWYGISVSAIGADGGDYPKSGPAPQYMLGNASLLNFAQSPLCTNSATNATYGACTYLANASQGTAISTGGHACCKTSVIYNQLLINFHPTQETSFTNAEFFLGMSYAAYNFSQKYMSHQFAILPSYGIHIPTSQYPSPYNTAYIKSLNLLDNFVLGATSDVENGGPPSSNTVSADKSYCLAAKHGGNTGFYLAGGADTNIAFPQYLTREPKYIRNMMYYEALCAATSIMMPSTLQYLPGFPSWGLMTAFGGILNRMQNVGNNQFHKVTVTASDATTNVTLIGGSGKPLLSWFYTNKTSPDTASVTLIGSTYHISSSGWIALSALDWSVVGSGSAGSIPLRVTIPARGWNPIYIMNSTANLQPLYQNVNLVSKTVSGNTGTYVLNGPHAFSSWFVIQSGMPPTSVFANNTGAITHYNSLSSLNQTIVGMHWAGSAWQNLTQTGWYYDSGNQLLYIHFLSGSPVSLTVQQGVPVTSTTSTTTSSTTTSSTTTSSTTSTNSITSTSSSTSQTTTTSNTTSSTTQSTISTETLVSSIVVLFLAVIALMVYRKRKMDTEAKPRLRAYTLTSRYDRANPQ